MQKSNSLSTELYNEEVFDLPTFIEIESDSEDLELKIRMSKMTGGKIKQYKKEKSLGILC